MSYPVISVREEVQAAYEAMRDEGTAHTLAEMFALQTPPSGMTDNVFWEGRWNQFAGSPQQGDYYKKVAEAHGQVTHGKMYLSSLARFPGDPEAWVDGRGDVQRLVEKRGWLCDGAVKVTRGKQAELKPCPIDPALVEEEAQAILDHHPEPQKADVEAIREEVTEKRKAPWARKALPKPKLKELDDALRRKK